LHKFANGFDIIINRNVHFGLFFDLVFFAGFFAARCCGGAFTTAPAARSKRAHASG
jgi:hypothetical protein